MKSFGLEARRPRALQLGALGSSHRPGLEQREIFPRYENFAALILLTDPLIESLQICFYIRAIHDRFYPMH